jgi:hypothetical protein
MRPSSASAGTPMYMSSAHSDTACGRWRARVPSGRRNCLLGDPVAADRDLLPRSGPIFAARAHHRRAHRAGVVERARIEEAREAVRAFEVEALFLGAEVGQLVGEELQVARGHVR